MKPPAAGWVIARARGFEARLAYRGRVFARRGATRDEALARLAILRSNITRGLTDGLRARSRRERAEGWVQVILEKAIELGWAPAFTAKVVVAQLSPSRIKRDIFGPCAYCGSWVAATIDHVIPTSRGGPDEASNLVSACWSCNSRKSDRGTHLVATLEADAPVVAGEKVA